MPGRARTDESGRYAPKVLVFSTNTISDPGIDLAGSAHLPYPSGVMTIAMPCTSGIKPAWVAYAIDRGFDGVFIAADGEECAYLPDCSVRAARITDRSQQLLGERGINRGRVKMAAICSVCADPFTNYLREFCEQLAELGPAGADGTRTAAGSAA